ncbi:hypothetical protein LguiA_013041 [Lonicera macranthoides]
MQCRLPDFLKGLLVRSRKKENCSTITRSEKEGGLNITEVHKTNTAQLAKVGCNPALGKDHLCTGVLKGK